jgi:hypothetical protein
MKTFIAFVVFIVLAAAFMAVLKGAKKTDRAGAYRPRKLMTDNEQEFFGRLVVALPDHYIFPQVAMSALIEAASSEKKTAHSDRLKIAQQRADYVVCDKQCEVVAVVELDDKTHSRAKDTLRDSRLEQAGIRTVRFQSRSKPAVAALRAAVLGTAPATLVPAEASLTSPAPVATSAGVAAEAQVNA